MTDQTRRPADSDQRLWVVDSAVAYVDQGRVTLQIDRPSRHLLRRDAFNVADKVWFASQFRKLDAARRRGETDVIPLTDRRRRSSIRLGGGFMITQGTKLIVARRGLDAPRPGQFCECGGVFETDETMAHADNGSSDYIASLLKESQELVLVRGTTLFLPQVVPTASTDFQPPGELAAYNRIIEAELRTEVTAARIPVSLENIRSFAMKILDYENAVKLQFAYAPEIAVEITAEVDSSSLECVGVISYPEDIDAAVAAFEGKAHPEEASSSEQLAVTVQPSAQYVGGFGG